jgi:hypothetical protein
MRRTPKSFGTPVRYLNCAIRGLSILIRQCTNEPGEPMSEPKGLWIENPKPPTQEERAENLYRSQKLGEWHASIYAGATLIEKPFELWFHHERQRDIDTERTAA